MFDEAEALGEAVLPNKRFRSVEHARASRRLRKLLSWQVYSRRLGSSLGVLRGVGRLLSAGRALAIATLVAAGYPLIGSVDLSA